jgi:hypothetical protein
VLVGRTYCCDSNEHIVNSTHLVEEEPRVKPQHGANGSSDGERNGNARDSISTGMAASSHCTGRSSRCGRDMLVMKQMLEDKLENPSGGLAGMQEYDQ